MKYDREWEEGTENMIFICNKCHNRIMGGKNSYLVFTQHKEKCGSTGFKFVLPSDKHYKFVRTYSPN